MNTLNAHWLNRLGGTHGFTGGPQQPREALPSRYIILLLTPVLLLTIALVWTGARSSALDALAERSAVILARFHQHLQSTLDKYEFLPQVLARDARIIGLLQQPANPKRIEAANRYLQDVNRIAGAAATYVIDRNGLTLAASNWDSPAPFVGQNFAFRPYFQAAIQGETGRYPALGTTSNRRGYYYAYPVSDQADIIGVVVVKVGVDVLEQDWQDVPQRLLVSDANGVVFISNRLEWRFRLLQALPEAQLQEIKASRQYGGSELALFPIAAQQPWRGQAELWTLSESERVDYLTQSVDLAEQGWRAYVLTPTGSIRSQVLMSVAVTALAGAIAMLIILLALQRRAAVRQELRYQRAIEQSLRTARDELEQRVQERTRELSETNKQLDREVHEHKRAEQELRQAQDSLVQATKLATIGYMAAGLTHELNQPLTALRAYLDNARILLQRNRQEDVATNIAKMQQLTERMAQLTQQLKTFSRRSEAADTQAVSLQEKIRSALNLVSHTRNPSFSLQQDWPEQDIGVLAEPIRLEQVLVNILQNALDAMRNQPESQRVLRLSCQAGDPVVLSIRDSGPGIPAAILPNIFEPFTTSKPIGEGLGLGMSISYSIIQQFGGELSARNHPEGGAEFRVQLRAAKD